MRGLPALAVVLLWPLVAAAAEQADVAPPGEVQLELGVHDARDRLTGTRAERFSVGPHRGSHGAAGDRSGREPLVGSPL